MLSESDFTALVLTLKLAALTTLLLLLLGTPLAWWLTRTRWRFKFLLEAVIAMPLVLPPSVLGFYLLVAFGPHGPLGSLMAWLGGPPLAFTFTGLIVGSVFYSIPFVVQPLQNAFSAIGCRPLEVAATLRASPLDRFFTVAVVSSRSAFVTAAVLGFAHTVGEFGVVLMIGGNIPGHTQVLSIAIYNHVEALEYAHAHQLSGGLLLFSFCLLMIVYALNRRFTVIQP